MGLELGFRLGLGLITNEWGLGLGLGFIPNEPIQASGLINGLKPWLKVGF
jgi:hypothetical protein